MPGFVWVKTMKGTRTAGFFALRASDDKLYESDGTSLDPPSASVIISNEELITAINKSTPKGIYVCAWKETSQEWSQYLHSVWNEHLGDYDIVSKAIAKIVDATGVKSPHNSSKEVVAENKMGAKARKDKIERDFKAKITTTLQLLKPMTVRALAIAIALTIALTLTPTLGPARRALRSTGSTASRPIKTR